MPMVVVEGMDGSGKTTLISHLRNSGISFWGVSRSKPVKTIKELESFLLWMGSIPPGQLVILDRHPLISEEVYGPVLRQENLNKLLDPVLVKHQLKKILLLIYCKPPFGTIQRNIIEGNHLDGINEHRDQLCLKYDTTIYELLNGAFGIPVLEYDYTDQTKSLNLIKEKLSHD